MADIVLQQDLGDLRRTRIASTFAASLAGGAGNNAVVTGVTIDRLSPSSGSIAGTAVLTLAWTTTLAAGQTLSLTAIEIDNSPDGQNWSLFQTFPAALVATGAGTIEGTTDLPIDLVGAERFLRVKFTPVLSAANADTSVVVCIATLGGTDRLPA